MANLSKKSIKKLTNNQYIMTIAKAMGWTLDCNMWKYRNKVLYIYHNNKFLRRSKFDPINNLGHVAIWEHWLMRHKFDVNKSKHGNKYVYTLVLVNDGLWDMYCGSGKSMGYALKAVTEKLINRIRKAVKK